MNQNAGKTKCGKGHPFDEENTIRYTVGGIVKRYCRACRKAQRQIDNAREVKRHRLERERFGPGAAP